MLVQGPPCWAVPPAWSQPQTLKGWDTISTAPAAADMCIILDSVKVWCSGGQRYAKSCAFGIKVLAKHALWGPVLCSHECKVLTGWAALAI